MARNDAVTLEDFFKLMRGKSLDSAANPFTYIEDLIATLEKPKKSEAKIDEASRLQS